jgi:polyhydroxyalkanoate synthesis regulator phasin
MIDLIKKSLLAGIGAAVVTRDKILEATRYLVKEGKMTTDDAEKLAEDLIGASKQQWNEMQDRISETVKKGMESLDIGSKREFRDLKARLDDLERRVDKLEGRPEPAVEDPESVRREVPIGS